MAHPAPSLLTDMQEGSLMFATMNGGVREIAKKDVFVKEKSSSCTSGQPYDGRKNPRDVWYESAANLDSATDRLCDLGLTV